MLIAQANVLAARVVERPGLASHQLVRATIQQDIGRALGEHQHPVQFRVRVNRRHQLAVGGEGDLSDALKAPGQRLTSQARLARSHQQSALGGIALDDPTAIALLQHGVVGAIPYGKRTPELDAPAVVDRQS